MKPAYIKYIESLHSYIQQELALFHVYSLDGALQKSNVRWSQRQMRSWNYGGLQETRYKNRKTETTYERKEGFGPPKKEIRRQKKQLEVKELFPL